MIVRNLEDIVGSENEVDGGNWVSRRLLLAGDAMGFSVHDTVIRAGTETHIHYVNHLEAVYCIGGRGEIEAVTDGRTWRIEEGTIYALDRHDEHYLRADPGSDLRLVCVFNPPLTGREVHDESGVYPLLTEHD
ncbi:MAG: ectoine synthase [Arenicellales bacterium]|jgi:L-ectoine synthase